MNKFEQNLEELVDLKKHPIHVQSYRKQCKRTLDLDGVLTLPGFLNSHTISSIVDEGNDHQHLAFYTGSKHNIYLTESDSDFPATHPRNREVLSSKGCITTDQIPQSSALHGLYNHELFRDFLCDVLEETQLYEYADPLSSINLHYAGTGQELGWHFDNSAFAITLLVQKPDAGGVFEYVKDVRDAELGEMNYEQVQDILDGKTTVNTLAMDAGALVLFRGRNSMHRVTPVEGDVTRILAVLAYNTQAGVSLSESARKTFYGRLG